jgi:hypothetical protein
MQLVAVHFIWLADLAARSPYLILIRDKGLGRLFARVSILTHKDLNMKDQSKFTAIDIALRNNIEEAILKSGQVPGTNNIVLVNGDVIEALLDMVAVYASIHGFENYTSRILADKYTRGLAARIDVYRRMPRPSNVNVVPRSSQA